MDDQRPEHGRAVLRHSRLAAGVIGCDVGGEPGAGRYRRACRSPRSARRARRTAGRGAGRPGLQRTNWRTTIIVAACTYNHSVARPSKGVLAETGSPGARYHDGYLVLLCPAMALLRRPVAAARLCVRIAVVLGRIRYALVEGVLTGSGLLALLGNLRAGHFLDVPAPPRWRAGLEAIRARVGSRRARGLGSSTYHLGVHRARTVRTELVVVGASAAFCEFVAEQLGLDAALFGDYAEKASQPRLSVL
jgi:hypothetical protein